MNVNEAGEFLSQLPLPAAHFNPSGEVVFLNSAFTKLLGYKKSDIPTVEAHWPIFFPDVAYREKVQMDWSTMLEKSAKLGEPIQPMLLDIVAKNGEVKKLEVHSLQVGTFAITIWIDFTEKMKAQEALEKMAHRLSLALQSGSIGVWDWNLKTNEIIWDNTMFKIYGLEKIVPMPYESWVKSVLPEDYPLAVASLELSMNNKEKIDVEFRIRRPDGNIRHIKASQDVVLDNSGKVIRVIGVNIDITEQRELEMSLINRNIELQNALDEIKTLQGVIPICMYCKEIRDEKGSWNRLENYISEHSEAQFSHGICDKCIKEHFPEVAY